MSDFATARENMVENQLRPSNVDDLRVLAAFRAVPREAFLPARLRGVAYQDEDIDLGNGRHLIEPLALGRLLQVSAPRADEVALVLGCDTGYAAAVLSKLVATVFLLVPETVERAPIEARFDEFGFDNIVVQGGVAGQGLPKEAPFNLVLLAGAVAAPPEKLLGQLDEGGRFAAVVDAGLSGKITVLTRIGGAIGSYQPYDAGIPPLLELRPEPAFAF